jgi:hypothetical protein
MPEEAPQAEKEDRPERRRRRSPITWAILITAFLVLVLIAPGIHPFRRSVPPSEPVPILREAPPQETTASSQVAQCEQVIQQGQQLGLIRNRPQRQRIDVEEKLWTLMDASERRGLLLALRCSAYPASARPTDQAVAYSAQSGKRLAQTNAQGVAFD